jgi:galactose mutarotase-like enzyme
MKHVIKTERIQFVSDSYNVEPWTLRFNDEELNYFWHPAGSEKLGTAVCFPLMGFLPDNTYILDGKEYTMGVHGFAQDREFGVAEKSEDRVCYELLDDSETYRQYPWHFRFRLIYSVEGDTLKTEYQVENRDTKDLYFSVGGHPRYTCPIDPKSRFEDYGIEFEKPEDIRTIVKSYGPLENIEKCFSADGKRIRLDYSMFSKGCFCFHPYNSSELVLKSEKNNRGIRIRPSGASHLQFWTTPGAPFLAIEPFYGSTSSLPARKEDSDWKGRPGTLHIPPGETYTCAHYVTILR